MNVTVTVPWPAILILIFVGVGVSVVWGLPGFLAWLAFIILFTAYLGVLAYGIARSGLPRHTRSRP